MADTEDRAAGRAIAGAIDPGCSWLPILFAGLRLTHRDLVAPLCTDLLFILDRVNWFSPAIEARLGDEAYLTQLTRFAEPSAGLGLYRSVARAPMSWAVRTIGAAASSRIEPLAPLSAIFVLAALDLEASVAGSPARSSIEELGRKIRGVSDRPAKHPLRPALRFVETASSPVDFSSNFFARIDASEHEALADDWRRIWIPWIQTIAAPMISDRQPKRVVGQPKKASAVVRHVPRRPAFNAVPPPLRIIGRPRDPIPAPEPADEEVAPIDFVRTGITPEKAAIPDRGEARSLCFQAIRQRNTDLLPEHIEALSTGEFRLVLAGVRACLEKNIDSGPIVIAAACIVYQLLLATGRTLEAIEAIRLVESRSEKPTELELDLASGCIRQLVLRPPGAVEPDSDAWPTESILEWFAVPLPPSLASVLQKLYRRSPRAFIKEWFEPPGAFAEIKAVLRAIPNLPEIATSISRGRRWIASNLMHLTGDIAQVMLLCGDSVGRATSPIYYYSPRITDLQNSYIKTVWTAFGDSSASVPVRTQRVGSKLAVMIDAVVAGLRNIHRKLDVPAVRFKARGFTGIAEQHNELAAYVLMHLVIMTTHRPTQALFSITRNDIELESGLCVISDKKIDAAHLFRLVALSTALSRQIGAFISHLEALSQDPDIPRAFREALSNALNGSGGLFFFVGQDTKPESSLEAWTRCWPEIWRSLPVNWYRHFFATHAREAGIEAHFVSLQMGHLESAGFPFSRNSPLPPERFAIGVKPALARLEALLDFRHRIGAAHGVLSSPPVPRFRSWARDIEFLNQQVRNLQTEHHLQVRSMGREVRTKSLEFGLPILTELSPAMAELIQAQRAGNFSRSKELANRSPQPSLTSEQAILLLERIAQFEESELIKISAHRELSRMLRKLRRDFPHLDIADLGFPFALPPSDATPFFSGMMLAKTQIQQLRKRFLQQAANLRAAEPGLFLVLSLVLLEGVSDQKELAQLLRISSVGGLADFGGPHLVLPVMDGETEIGLGLGGGAALALTSVRPGCCSAVKLDEINTKLATAFPDLFIVPDALDVLLETAGVANRIDNSGLSRFSISADGSIPASHDIQAGLLRETVIKSVVEPRDPNRWESAPEFHDRERYEEERDDSGPSENELRLSTRFLRRVSKAWHPKTHGISASKAVTLTQVRDYLVTLIESKDMVSDVDSRRRLRVEHSLAHFAEYLASHGTARRPEPAVSTVATYLSAIGPHLSVRLAGIDLWQLDQEDFIEIYQGVIDEKTAPHTTRRRAEQLFEFHQLLVNRFQIEPIPASEFGEYLPSDRRAGDANSITSSEYELARSWLTQSIDQESPSPLSVTGDRRQLRIARLFLDLLYFSGARISEIAFLRHSDVLLDANGPLLFVRRNLYRRLKTSAGRRKIELKDMGSYALEEFRLWVEAERLRLGTELESSTLLFATTSSGKISAGVGKVRQLISMAFELGAGRRCWPHLIRHYFVFDRIKTALTRLSLLDDPAEHVKLARQLAATAVEVGHARFSTSVSCYFHLPWVFRAIESKQLASMFGRHELAALSDRSLASVDKIGIRPISGEMLPAFPAKSDRFSWSERLLFRLARPIPKESRAVSPDNLFCFRIKPLGVAQLVALLRRCRHPDDMAQLGFVIGLTKSDSSKLDRAIAQLAKETRYRLLPTSKSGRIVRMTPIPRTIDSRGISGLANRIDNSSFMVHFDIQRLFRACYQARGAQRTNRWVGLEADICELHGLLSRLGVLEIPPVEKSGHRNRQGIPTFVMQFNDLERVSAFGLLTQQLACSTALSMARTS